jgi:hypothetical protein
MKKRHMPLNRLVQTAGNGLWSSEYRKVKLRNAQARFIFGPGEKPWGELKVFFYKNTWNPDKHGLIYTDGLWLKEFHKVLAKKGFSKKACKDVDYSEQGMQGDNYVSLDIGNNFYKEWAAKKYYFEKETW